MIKFTPFILAIFIVSCIDKPGILDSSTTAINPIDAVKANEQKALEKQYDDLGTLIKTISYNLKTNNFEDFADGIIPWASIEKPKDEIANLIDEDEIVIKENSIRVILDYPMTNSYEFSITSKNGFTRSQLLLEISNHYYKVYSEEERTATIKTIPVKERTTMYNRNETNGTYGIWGHDITDLVLAEILVYKTPSENIVLALNIES